MFKDSDFVSPPPCPDVPMNITTLVVKEGGKGCCNAQTNAWASRYLTEPGMFVNKLNLLASLTYKIKY